jgi:ABC-type sugar transport system substrate-binding protein
VGCAAGNGFEHVDPRVTRTVVGIDINPDYLARIVDASKDIGIGAGFQFGFGGNSSSLAYIGQDLFLSGVEMGKRIVELVKEGPVALFIATKGQLNIQPRIDGAIQAIEDSGAPIEYEEIETGAEVPVKPAPSVATAVSA